MGVDPVLAVVMDRTRTPIGRYRAWMLAGAPILMLGVWQLFMAPKGIGIAYLIVWYLVYALASSMVGLARAAWSANLVTKYDQRARFYGYLGFITVFGALFILLTPVISERLVKHPNNVHLMGWAMLALIPIATMITALVREPVNADATAQQQHPHFELRDYWAIATKPEVMRLFFSQFCLTLGPGWMANLYIFFFTNARLFTQGQASILLIVYILAGVVGAPVIGYVGGRFGKHRTLIASTILYSLGLCTVVVAPKANMIVGIPIMLWCGFMANGFDLMTGAMMADVGDQVRLEQGKERMALLYAVTGLASKLAAAGAVIIAYPLLSAIGYQPTLGMHNTQGALDGLTVVFITGPIFWCVAGGLCFLGWKLDATKHASIREELEARDELLAQQSAMDNPVVHHGGLDPEIVRG
jgi:Na+/melibiose symporter-like transporter